MAAKVVMLMRGVLPRINRRISALIRFSGLIPIHLIDFRHFRLSIHYSSFCAFNFLLFLIVHRRVPIFQNYFLIFEDWVRVIRVHWFWELVGRLQKWGCCLYRWVI